MKKKYDPLPFACYDLSVSFNAFVKALYGAIIDLFVFIGTLICLPILIFFTALFLCLHSVVEIFNFMFRRNR